MNETLMEYLSFKRMITPVLIQVIYWILTVVVVIVGLVLLITGDGDDRWAGLALFIFGPIAVRLYSEILIVVFKINETLSDIRDQTSRD